MNLEKHFAWYPELRLGHFPQVRAKVKRDYFAEYQVLATTEMGKAITMNRVALVQCTLEDPEAPVLDVGIGCGAFLEAYGWAGGFDVDPKAIAWLVRNGAYVDLYNEDVGRYKALTLWDSLEHIEDPGAIFDRPDAPEFVFISTPIYTSMEDVLESKHFKPNEHCWYFTSEGLCEMLAEYGYGLLEHNSDESDLGREAIETFVFRKEGT